MAAPRTCSGLVSALGMWQLRPSWAMASGGGVEASCRAWRKLDAISPARAPAPSRPTLPVDPAATTAPPPAASAAPVTPAAPAAPSTPAAPAPPAPAPAGPTARASASSSSATACTAWEAVRPSRACSSTAAPVAAHAHAASLFWVTRVLRRTAGMRPGSPAQAATRGARRAMQLACGRGRSRDRPV